MSLIYDFLSYLMLNDQLSQKLKLVGFGFNMNIMLQHPPSRAYGPIPVHVESQSPLWTFFKINKWGNSQGEGSNPGPPAKPSSDTMLNDQLS